MSRKRIPTDPIPGVYQDVVAENNSETVETQNSNLNHIPSSKIHGGGNLKKIGSFNKLRKSRKINSQKIEFINHIKNSLSLVKLDSEEERNTLLIEVINSANMFFIYGDYELRESSKNEAIRELMLPFFNEDVAEFKVDVLKIQSKIQKSTLIRRVAMRVYNFFCIITRD